ncbi:MAG: hypothetical protein Q8S73_25945 [Deltaproteobacteria bacterium]|nr:hypothetical protein [Myxococcales bacterium]MDP3217580.1 hypothetical protein [Deltaproteobacteria bacterium]
MMNATHDDASTEASIAPSELVPWYIIVSKLALAMGTSMAMLAGA